MFIFFLLASAPAVLFSMEAITPENSPGYVCSGMPSPEAHDGGPLKSLMLLPSLALGPAYPIQFEEEVELIKTPTFIRSESLFQNPYERLFNKNPIYLLVSKLEEGAVVSTELKDLKNFENNGYDDTSDLLLDYIKSNLGETSPSLISLILHERIYEKHTYDINDCMQTLIVLAKLNLDIDPTYFLFFHEQLEYLIFQEPNRSRKVYELYADFSYIIQLMSQNKIASICESILADDIVKYLFDCFVIAESAFISSTKRGTFYEIFKSLVNKTAPLKDQPSILIKMLLANNLAGEQSCIPQSTSKL